jgi:hypothetical protein
MGSSLEADVKRLVEAMEKALHANGLLVTWTPGLWAYALLVLATDTPINRAIAYVKDTGSPEHARGRLLLRAAERALRASGELGGEQ